jgi:ABC-type branched-subunit amino acid transport system substrate-binding protein
VFGRSQLRLSTIALVVFVSFAAACGGGSDSNDKADSPKTTSTAAAPGSAGPTVKILVVDQGKYAAQPLVDILASAKAAAEAITKTGQTIDLDVCQPPPSADPSDTQAALGCVRQAIDHHDAAFIGQAGDDGMKLLSDAQIPVFAPNALTPEEYNNPISFQPTGGAPVLFAAQGAAMVDQGAKKITLLNFDIDAAKPLAEFAKKAIVGAGGEVVDEIHVPFQAVDVSSQVQQLKKSGADGALIITTEDIAAMLIRTMNQFGVKMPTSAPAGGLRQETLDSLGNLADGLLSGSPTPKVNVDGKNPSTLDQYINEMKAADSYTADNTRNTGVASWIAVHAIAAASKDLKAKSIDGPALLQALQASPGLDLPIAGKWVPSASGPFDSYKRVSNGTGFYLKYVGGGNWNTLKPENGSDMFALIQKGGGVG